MNEDEQEDLELGMDRDPSLQGYHTSAIDDQSGGFASHWPFLCFKGMGGRDHYLCNAHLPDDKMELTRLMVPQQFGG